MIIESAKINANKFRWENTIGSAMASDLGYRAGQAPIHRIHDWSDDQGLYVIGKKENKAFIFSRAMRGRENEILGWLFNSVDYKFSLVIFND
jgi:hypothetical protein